MSTLLSSDVIVILSHSIIIGIIIVIIIIIYDLDYLSIDYWYYYLSVYHQYY